MSTALVPVDDLMKVATMLAPSAMLPSALRGKVADVLAIVIAGRELGLQPMASLRLLNVIEGKPVLNADGMAAVVRGSGKCTSLDMIESTDKVATFETVRSGGKPQRVSYTIEEAKQAKLAGKDNWVKHPSAMLRARALSALCRMVYQDVLAGVYTDDEASEFARAAPAPIEAEVVEPIDELAWQLRISAVDSIDGIKALREEFDDLPDTAAKISLRDLISKRRSAIARKYADDMTKGAADVG